MLLQSEITSTKNTEVFIYKKSVLLSMVNKIKLFKLFILFYMD